MTISENLKDLRAGIVALQRSLAAKVAEMRADERVSPEHRARLDTMEAQANAVQEKLPEEEGSAWDAVKQEVKRDLDALAQDFEHTVNYIDEHYREKK
jgi:hypothetical protein